MSDYRNPITDWLKSNIQNQALGSVLSGQVDPNSALGQSITSQPIYPDTPNGQAVLSQRPLSLTAFNPTLEHVMPGGPSYVGSTPFNGGLSSPQPQVPTPPPRPANLGNAAGAGLQAFHNNLTGGGSIPLPPPRPQNLQQAPSANQLIDNWNSKQHGLIPNILHAFGVGGQQNPLASIGQGIGGAVNGLGQGISSGLNGIFSGLFGAGG